MQQMFHLLQIVRPFSTNFSLPHQLQQYALPLDTVLPT